MLTGLLYLCLGTLVPEAAAGGAGDLRNEWSGEYPPARNLSITVAPLSLMEGRQPSLDMTAEVRTGESRSVAITSSSSIHALMPRDVGPKGNRVLGVQLRDYIVGGFDNGLFLGGQLAFTNPDFMRFRADRTEFGPLAGMKVSLSVFTVEGRAGAWLGMGKQGLEIEPKVEFATGFTF